LKVVASFQMLAAEAGRESEFCKDYSWRVAAICRTIESAGEGGNVMPQLQTARVARLEARISPDLKRRLEYAASLRGASLTEFVVQSAQEAATRAIRENEVLALSAEASIAFAEFFLNPPGPNEKAMAASKRYMERLGKEIVSE
jgi:uncharacterized protein (DUF1778 family)